MLSQRFPHLYGMAAHRNGTVEEMWDQNVGQGDLELDMIGFRKEGGISLIGVSCVGCEEETVNHIPQTLYSGKSPMGYDMCFVVSTLLNFVRMFTRAHEENCKQLEFERKKAQKEAESEKIKINHKQESEHLVRTSIKSGNIK
ncbi:Formin-like protein 17 [Vitis vinifera]|uniref:Formin-like protein 17 n=1 Tax=Vitis vinifera TaxID=29760 RepID=A0A438CJX9_VITVI|nr:Formin-like protein 17 [Vitis vinifera]